MFPTQGGAVDEEHPPFSFETTSADPLTVGDAQLTPRAAALTVRLPSGGLVWNRPASVRVERNGSTETISILDVTRIAQVVLYGLAALFTALTIVLMIRGRRSTDG
jgi:hypothetical protein